MKSNIQCILYTNKAKHSVLKSVDVTSVDMLSNTDHIHRCNTQK